ncbi:AMP-binding protein [Methylococcus mesophilus]|uniref:AMP-binding protein n=1 Tax=Methylococcus mesophilus TaxID=2993564 RepID=UPI00224AF782|nr:AMP-binding protein [Methylococcus mesophilus]UZR30012.1 AMP-binding protein [Methylococcus mesophilus]
MADFPLLTHPFLDGAVAYPKGRTATVREFLGEAAALAGSLPEQPYLLNDCADRYRFAVVFAAALLRRQVSLLPPTLTPETVRQLAASFPGLYCLTDDPAREIDLPIRLYPDDLAPQEVERVPVLDAGQIAAIGLTSGSTGTPVPHAKTWGSLVRSARAEGERLGIVQGRHTVLGTVPAQHMYGFESTVLLPLQNGAAFSAARPFYPADVCAEIARLPGAAVLVTTPFHLRALLNVDGELPHIDLLISATAPLAPQFAQAAEARFGAPLLEIYGCTEAGQLATRRSVEGPEWKAFPGISVFRAKDGFRVRGGHVAGEVRLDDVLELRSPQRFVWLGRSGDMVNIAGKRTSLAYLNHQIASIPGVADAVFVMPDEDSPGAVTRLTAYAVAPDLTHAGLMQALRQRLDPAFLPRPLHLVASLPRNATGKLPRKALDALSDSLREAS